MLMASWQSYVLDPFLRVQIKRKLVRARTAEDIRKAFNGKMPAPRGAKFAADNLRGVAGEWVTAGAAPAAAEPAGTLLYLHGGGYVGCSPKTHRAITGGYALRGIKVFCPDYRLAPEHPFPAAVEDALAVYKALLERGTAPGALAVGGDSAGGGLTCALLLAAKAEGLPMPASALVFSPLTDLAATGATLRSNLRRDALLPGGKMSEGFAFYLNGADPETPLASPLYGDLAGLPPLLIQVGAGEVLRDDAERFAAKARAAGVAVDFSVWRNMPHVWQLFQAVLPEARQALDQAAAFARARFQPPDALRAPI
jgi:acetyl esterase/lipase